MQLEQLKSQIKCFIGFHDHKFIKRLSTQAMLTKCSKCGVAFATYFGYPQTTMTFSADCCKKYEGFGVKGIRKYIN